MTQTQDDTRELPRERAHRLLGKSVENLSGGFDRLQDRLLQPYSRYLSDEDKNDLRNYLRRRVEAVEKLLDTQGEGPAFSWSDTRWD